MSLPRKLASQQKTEEQHQLAAGEQTQSQAAREFQSVEELLRHDAAQTPLPPSIAERLQASIGPQPPANRPWWKRILGG